MHREAGPGVPTQSRHSDAGDVPITLRQWAYTVFEEGQLEGAISHIIDAILIALINSTRKQRT